VFCYTDTDLIRTAISCAADRVGPATSSTQVRRFNCEAGAVTTMQPHGLHGRCESDQVFFALTEIGRKAHGPHELELTLEVLAPRDREARARRKAVGQTPPDLFEGAESRAER
jgi:hypothetical protein